VKKEVQEYIARDAKYFKKQLSDSKNVTNSFKSQCAKHILEKSATLQWKLVFKPVDGVDAETKVLRHTYLDRHYWY
jgi:hypothetical protein